MSKLNLSQDLSIITGVSKLSLDNLSDRAIICACHGLRECLLSRESQCEIDIGIGLLYIKVEETEIKYKFIPSKKFEERVAFTVRNKLSPLTIEADKALGERIDNAYKSLL